MSTTGTKKIYVIFYTTYGHIYKLVEEAVKGINSVPGSEAVVFQVRITFDCRCTSSPCCDAVVLRARGTGFASCCVVQTLHASCGCDLAEIMDCCYPAPAPLVLRNFPEITAPSFVYWLCL